MQIINDLFKELYPLYLKLDGEYIVALSNVEHCDAIKTVLSMVYCCEKEHSVTKDSIRFDNYLGEILLAYYSTAMVLKIIISDRGKGYISQELCDNLSNKPGTSKIEEYKSYYGLPNKKYKKWWSYYLSPINYTVELLV